ncbi:MULTISPECIES: ExbD/TolR family protein [Flavobacteriaceae]|uniref:ExbD/TolR family protein n=1 Tax=Flavobacteriaceae TaxID=49546 RepID=UPI001492F486|nr:MULTISPECIES: biopolymer transporter ExbD [Allomuricauda]MDC6367142.1 biopolymer transporter ExbD [Muricauda sp. AC10]
MERRKEIPEVNAGSMADIAFLLLIFFLVTTTIETDVGLNRKLPPSDTTPPPKISERNILRVSLNQNDELFVEDGVVQLNDLKAIATSFLDNGGIPIGDAEHCTYCLGERNQDSSDNPIKAIISLNSDRKASYGIYIKVQNELIAAYNELRNREAQRRYGMSYEEMEQSYEDPATSLNDKMILKERIVEVREMYPLKLIEAQAQI